MLGIFDKMLKRLEPPTRKNSVGKIPAASPLAGSEGGAWTSEVHHALHPGNINDGLCNFLVQTIRPRNFLEFGSGTGLLANSLATRLSLEQSYGLEPEIVPQTSAPNLAFLKFDAMNDVAPACLNQKFDLVLSIEVIEHIPREKHAEIFDFLAARAGSWVVFSAARPGQGGHGHVAERPEQEWREEWISRGFIFSPQLTVRLRNCSDVKNINHRRNLQVFVAPPGYEMLDHVETLAKPYIRDLLSIIKRESDFLTGNLFYVDMKGARGGAPDFTLRIKRKNLFEVAAKARNGIEIGFNGGHSALLMLLANPELKLTVVDLFDAPFTQACYDYLSHCFAGRLTGLKGDSREVVPKLAGQKFDLAHVDGGKEHTLAADLKNLAPLMADDHVLVIDDTQNVALNSILVRHEHDGVVQSGAFTTANRASSTRRWKHRIGRYAPRPELLRTVLSKVRAIYGDTDFPSIYTTVDSEGRSAGDARAAGLISAIRDIEEEAIAGAFVEIGVAAGHSSVIGALTASRFIAREFWLFETFEGFVDDASDSDLDLHGKAIGEYDLAKYTRWDCSDEGVRKRMLQTGIEEQHLFLVQGPIEATGRDFAPQPVSILRLDADLHLPTMVSLEVFYDRLAPGGWLIVDDYGHWRGCRKAVDEFFAARGETFRGEAWDYTCYAMRKPRHDVNTGTSR